MSPDPILKTKLFIPPLREGVVSRRRLVEIINEGVKKKVLFVSASAGFGKSTLMVEWVSQTKMPVTWLSLDRTENDPLTFLSYLITSVQSLYENLGEVELGALKAPGSPPVGNLLKGWINEISEHTEDFVLIMDDFHHIQNQDVIDLLCNLTDHQPPQLHLLLASRAEPPKCFSRMRARGDVLDLDIADLRFTVEEAVTYLKSHLGEKITMADARILNDRTEGWITGLQMAVLSMRSSKDTSQFVTQFSAQNRYITDYLLDEVLAHQPEKITQFLLATSILEIFTAPLCNHVVGIENSQELIETLERSGLFIIPLDTTRTWYRYHHLFAELLRKRLDELQFFQREVLHRRAFEWFASREMLEECISHAFAVKDYGLVIKQIERSLNQIMAQGQFRNYLSWVERIPPEYLKEKPRLEIVKIFMLHEMGRLDERDKQIKFVDSLLGPLPEKLDQLSSGEIINHGILAAIKTIVYSSGYLLMDDARKYYAISTRLLPENYLLWRAMAAGAIPFLDRALGNYEQAINGYNDVLEQDRQAGFIFQTFIAYSALTKAYLEVGKLNLAIITCQKAIDIDVKHGADLPFAKLVYLIMGELMYQVGNLSSAESYIEMGLEHVVRHGDVYSIIDGYSTLARIQLAGGDAEQAFALIREMKTVISELSPSQNALKIMNTWKAYIMILAGQGEQAKEWVKEPGFDQLDGKYLFDLHSHTYVGIYRVSQNPIRIYSDLIQMILARLYLFQEKTKEALQTIDDLLLDIVKGEGKKYKIEAMIIKSLILQKMDRMPEAAGIIHEAIHLAATEGFVQVFLNEGVFIRELLEKAREMEHSDIGVQVFVLQLLEKIQLVVRQETDQNGTSPEQLTKREIEVLECLASGTSYFQAAEKLSISRNTLKTHTKRIYQKLGVNGLLQALNKAKELNLLH
jgi:LuxR family transcriptional regulator, maltose regulon positive regulatory protein